MSRLLPISVTFFPEITVVEIVHYLYALHHVVYKELLKSSIPEIMRPSMGQSHFLFYKDGKRVMSLVQEGPLFYNRWETCHSTLHDMWRFDTLEEAMKEIEETLTTKEELLGN